MRRRACSMKCAGCTLAARGIVPARKFAEGKPGKRKPKCVLMCNAKAIVPMSPAYRRPPSCASLVIGYSSMARARRNDKLAAQFFGGDCQLRVAACQRRGIVASFRGMTRAIKRGNHGDPMAA